MKSTPAFIQRDCALWVDEDLKVGQASEMTLPPIKAKTEGFRNAGMATEREAVFGYEREPAKFKMMGLDPQVISAAAFMPGNDKTLMITGALQDEDGVTTNATCYMRGFLKGLDFEAWGSGKKIEAIEAEFEWNFLKLEIGGKLMVEADDFDLNIGGASQRAAIRSALLL